MLPDAVIFDNQDKSLVNRIPAQTQPVISGRPVIAPTGLKVTHDKIEESDDEDDQIPILNGSDSYYSDYYSDEDTPVQVTKGCPRPPVDMTINPRSGRPRPPAAIKGGFRRPIKRASSESTEPNSDPIPESDTPTETIETPTTGYRILPGLPGLGKTERRVSYHIDKSKKPGVAAIFKGCYTFTVTRGSSIVAKFSVSSDDKHVHFKCGDFQGAILIDSKDHSYYLRESNANGKDICSVRYTKATYDADLRSCVVYFHGISSLTYDATMIRSKPPSVNKHGAKCLSFGKRVVIPSMRNCILIDGESNEYVAVMKTSKTSLCVDVIPEIFPAAVVLIGVSAFLCKKL